MDDGELGPEGREWLDDERGPTPPRRRYWLLAVPVNAVIAALAVLPYGLAAEAVRDFVLAPRGWATADPTANDGAVEWLLPGLLAGCAFAGFVCANVLLGRWAGHTWRRWLTALVLNVSLALVVLLVPGLWSSLRGQ